MWYSISQQVKDQDNNGTKEIGSVAYTQALTDANVICRFP